MKAFVKYLWLLSLCLFFRMGSVASASPEPKAQSPNSNLCLNWIEGVDEYCINASTSNCNYWRNGEHFCLLRGNAPQEYVRKVDKRHSTAQNMHDAKHIHMPLSAWLAFYEGIEGVRWGMEYSSEFNYPHAHPDLPMTPSELGNVVRQIIRETIKPEYGLPIAGGGMDYSGDDYSHNELVVSLDFAFMPREQFNPMPPVSSLVISYEVRRFNKDRKAMPIDDPYFAPPVERHPPRVIMVTDDPKVFQERLRQAVSEIVTESTKPAVCLKKPTEQFCDPFYSNYLKGKTHGH